MMNDLLKSKRIWVVIATSAVIVAATIVLVAIGESDDDRDRRYDRYLELFAERAERLDARRYPRSELSMNKFMGDYVEWILKNGEADKEMLREQRNNMFAILSKKGWNIEDVVRLYHETIDRQRHPLRELLRQWIITAYTIFYVQNPIGVDEL